MDAGFRLSEDAQYILCCEEEADYQFYQPSPEENASDAQGEEEKPPDLEFSDWHWP